MRIYSLCAMHKNETIMINPTLYRNFTNSTRLSQFHCNLEFKPWAICPLKFSNQALTELFELISNSMQMHFSDVEPWYRVRAAWELSVWEVVNQKKWFSTLRPMVLRKNTFIQNQSWRSPRYQISGLSNWRSTVVLECDVCENKKGLSACLPKRPWVK